MVELRPDRHSRPWQSSTNEESMYRILRAFLAVTVMLAAYLAAITVYILPQICLVILGVLVWKHCRKAYRHTAHGTARWATPDDIPHMLDGDGLIIGHIDGRVSRVGGVMALFNSRLPARDACRKFLTALYQKHPRHLVRLVNAVHTAVFAPTGAGKGVSCVVPYLLTCPDSMVVVDFKGENVMLTAAARRKMGHRVIVVDPYKKTTQTPDTLNPLEFIDKDARTALDDCRDLAEMLVIRTGEEKEPHWADSAEVWIASMIAMVATFAEGADKSLQSVRALLTNPEKMAAAIKIMTESDAMDGMLSRLGHQLGHFKDKELSSTLTTTNRFMRFLDTSMIADSTRRSSFRPADLLKGKMTVYLVIPPDRMRAQMALLRMWIGTMLRAVVKGGLQSTKKVHFILDEAASLGHMDALDDAVDKLRGYGVRLTFIWQSIAQLRKCFPDGQDQTLLGNVTQVFFGVNDQQTAEYVSARLGESTIVVGSGGTGTSTTTSSQSSGQGGSSSTSYSSSSNENWQLMGRKLLKPEEVSALPDRVAITFTPGVPPLATRLVRYYEKEFKNLRHFGPVKTAFQTVRLFLATAMLAVVVTCAILSRTAERRYRLLPPTHGEIENRVQVSSPHQQ
jgi:type IV secretion system protein VirD4